MSVRFIKWSSATLKKMTITNAAQEALLQLQHFGLFQKVQYFFVLLPLVVVAMSNVNYIFVAEDVNHR